MNGSAPYGVELFVYFMSSRFSYDPHYHNIVLQFHASLFQTSIEVAEELNAATVYIMKKCTFPLLRMFMFVGMLPILLGSLSSCTPEQEEDDSHEAVDLGLSVKWASCNVGANSPEDYGGYYRWGEIKEYNINSGEYKYFQPIELGDGTSYYSPECWHNIVSNISGTSYDVAHVKWGRGWRMPTKDEVNELCEICSWQWTTINGINGYKVTGPNGNFIFLPAAGFKLVYEEELIRDCGELCNYWAGTLYSGRTLDYQNLLFDGAYYDPMSVFYIDSGFSVRPVKD